MYGESEHDRRAAVSFPHDERQRRDDHQSKDTLGTASSGDICGHWIQQPDGADPVQGMVITWKRLRFGGLSREGVEKYSNQDIRSSENNLSKHGVDVFAL